MREQTVDSVRIAVCRRDHQQRPPMLVRSVGTRAVFEEYPRDLRTRADGRRERRHARMRPRVRIRSTREQRTNGFEPAVHRGGDKWRHSVPIGNVRIGAAGQQKIDDIGESTCRRREYRGHAALVLCVYVDSAAQRAHTLEFPARGGAHQLQLALCGHTAIIWVEWKRAGPEADRRRP